MKIISKLKVESYLRQKLLKMKKQERQIIREVEDKMAKIESFRAKANAKAKARACFSMEIHPCHILFNNSPSYYTAELSTLGHFLLIQFNPILGIISPLTNGNLDGSKVGHYNRILAMN